jgi:YggT family protein
VGNMLLGITDYLLYLLGIVIVAQFVMSILISFNVINTYNEFVRTIWQALEKMTEPLYRPIRRILPDFGAIDFSPMVVIILITILRSYVIPEIAFATLS